MQPYLSLGFYHPKQWRTWAIGRDLTALTTKAGLIPHNDPVHGPLPLKHWWSSVPLHAEVRKRTLKTGKKGEDWHQDGDLKDGANMDCALVTWANTHPTQLRWKGVLYQPDPFEVVIFRNLAVHHRRPPDAPVERWLFRQRVQLPANVVLP